MKHTQSHENSPRYFLLFPLNARVARNEILIRLKAKSNGRAMLTSTKEAYMLPKKIHNKINEMNNLKDYILEKKEAKNGCFDLWGDFNGDLRGDSPNNLRDMEIKCLELQYFQNGYIIFGKVLGKSLDDIDWIHAKIHI